MKIAANLGFLFKDLPFLERFQAAASCGFHGVECGPEVYTYSLDELVAVKKKTNLQIPLINTPRALACLTGKETEFREDLEKAIRYAKTLECPRIHVMAGDVTDGSLQISKESATKTYIDNIKYAAGECLKHEIMIMIEYISTKPNYFLTSYKHVVSLVKKIDCENVRIQYDFHHAQKTDGNLCKFLEDFIKLIDHIQVSQVPDRHEPDLQGEINFPYVFQMLHKLGYNGWLGCEYIPRGDVKEGLKWAKDYLIM